MADRDVKWDDRNFRLQLNDGLDANLGEAGRTVRDQAKIEVSQQGAPTGQFKRRGGSKRRKQTREPSQPGEPPHKWTGRLMRGIRSKVFKRKGTVRVTAKGGGLMEYGTKTVAARPFLRPTLARMRSTVALILAKPIKTK